MPVNEIEIATRPGVVLQSDGKASIQVWAPGKKEVALVINEKIFPLRPTEKGYWQGECDMQAGDRYKMLLDGVDLPDPASLAQPEGVHGPSEVVDLGYDWTDQQWKNIPLKDFIIYELHVGTFTEEGTFASLADRLDYLKELGITAIEIMPVAQFPGSRNWGYDGVFPYAVQHSYGGAKGLQALVDAAHAKGVAIILDVVYNHLGPEGNYLGHFGPFFTDKYKTPWGQSLNFDGDWCDGVRDFFVKNALMWFQEFHVDALRLDAVHAITDLSPKHILAEISEEVAHLSTTIKKPLYLIAECDLNDTRFINPLSQGGYGLDAQWLDEFHHALRVAVGEEQKGYYADFNGVEHLAKAYRDAYIYNGQYAPHRHRRFGTKTENPGQQFVVFSQNHDQIGNRLLGERSSELVSFATQKLMAGVVLLAPFLPMLFMGEEYSETHPFQYFVSHGDPDLITAVRKGRKEEFSAFHLEGEAPDPQSQQTFEHSKLQWNLITQATHSTLLAFYRSLIALRKANKLLHNLDRNRQIAEADASSQVLRLQRWDDTSELWCIFNFSETQQQAELPLNASDWELLFDSDNHRWGGTSDAPNFLPGSSILGLQPRSFLIYTNNKI